MTVPSPVVALIAEGKITYHGAHLLETDNPLAPAGAWSGYGDVTVGGIVYKGLGAADLMQPVVYALGGSSEGIEVQLSSLNANFIPTVQAQAFRGRTIEVFDWYFDKHGTTLLHVERVLLGTLDQMTSIETPGGEGRMILKIESEAHGSQRSGGRLASDPSQRLIDPNDTSMRRVTLAPDITLRWGQDEDRAGKALNRGSTDQSSRR